MPNECLWLTMDRCLVQVLGQTLGAPNFGFVTIEASVCT